MLRLAANLSFLFTELPFLDRFDAAASAGFEAVEFLFPYEHDPHTLRKVAEAAGVEVVLFNLPPGDWAAGDRGIAVFADRADEFTRGLHQAMDYAQQLQTPRLHLMAGLAPSASGAALARYRDAIAEACDVAAEAGISIMIEPLNAHDMPGYFLDDFDKASALIRHLGHPNLQLQFDIYHRQIMHGDVLRGLEGLLPIVGHVQIASVPDRNEPGSGELDDLFILVELDRMGYRGFVGCEYRPRSGTLEGLEWRSWGSI